MKKIIIALCLIAGSLAGYSQNAKLDASGNFVATAAAAGTPAKDTGKYFTDAKGVRSKVFVSAKGKYFINVVSKTAGTPYKKYLTL